MKVYLFITNVYNLFPCSRNVSFSLVLQVAWTGFFFFQPKVVPLSDDVKQSLSQENQSTDVSLLVASASKPDYEVGSSSQLKLSFPQKNTGRCSYMFV